MPLRVPLAQHTTTGWAFGISLSLLPSSFSGMFVVPGAFAIANSPADLTSTNVAPLCFRVGNKARTFLEFHHL
jgi:hypothetical protein